MPVSQTMEHPTPGDTSSRRFFSFPRSRRARWSVWLAGSFAVLFVADIVVLMPVLDAVEQETAALRTVVLPMYAITMLLCGLSGGIVGLISIIKDGERSWLVWATLVPMALICVFLLGEFLVPH